MRKVRIHRTKNYQNSLGYIYIHINNKLIDKVKNGAIFETTYNSNINLEIQANFRFGSKNKLCIEKGTDDIDLVVAPKVILFKDKVEILNANNNSKDSIEKIKNQMQKKARNSSIINLITSTLIVWLFLLIFVI